MPKAEEPDFAYQNHSYADYLKWDLDERIELIKGRIFKLSPGPNRLHQKISGYLFNAFSITSKISPVRPMLRHLMCDCPGIPKKMKRYIR